VTDWSEYVEYKCRHRSCQADCINRVDSPAAQTKQCWSCYQVTDASELSSLTHHLPKSRRGESRPAASLD